MGDDDALRACVGLDFEQGMIVFNSTYIEKSEPGSAGTVTSMARLLAHAYLLKLRAWAVGGYMELRRRSAKTDPDDRQRAVRVCEALVSHGDEVVEGFKDAIPEYLWEPGLVDCLEIAIADAWGFWDEPEEGVTLPGDPSLN